MVLNKQIAAYFYTSLGQGMFRCNICGSQRKQAGGTGYFNLKAHLDAKHVGYQTSFEGSSGRLLQSYGFVSKEASHLFQWIQWIIMRNMAIHEVEDALTRAMSKLHPVTVKAVKKCLEGLAIKVGHKLEKELGRLFGLMFDRWSHAGVHYVALFAFYEEDGKLHVPLLGLPPLADGSQTADAHIKLFENILNVYDKTKDMVGFLVGDNCNTNQSSLLSEVNTLMVELRQENNYAELKKHTELLPV
ncbi:hypothetical protein JG687_00012305 [Phytophthora cactorum]|uniref:BED-type domain-containing protein n=1 Tax=Phytophthora cactorum TaxID=29920 RepID=A0A8T1U2A5_9STRA|nr:hypothetical protein JG687_00012305 [Phytophthora cactorum]